MNRRRTNLARRLLDDWLPPVLRDNRRLMRPLLRWWFAGTPDPDAVIEFKERAWRLSDDEMAGLYATLRCRGDRRPTDATAGGLAWIAGRIPPDCRTLLDVGCGRGFWARQCARAGLRVTGCDFVRRFDDPDIAFRAGSVENLPFADRSFDVVTCLHTLEHVRRLEKAVAELCRVCRRELFIIVPCQRAYRYTLDLHLHFFQSPGHFLAVSGLADARHLSDACCELVEGDIVCQITMPVLPAVPRRTVQRAAVGASGVPT